MSEEFKIEVYLDDGRIFLYHVKSEDKVREHAHAIITTGYRHNDGEVFEWFPPHRISKIKSRNISTQYTDKVAGT
jgi:hypothetical protein